MAIEKKKVVSFAAKPSTKILLDKLAAKYDLNRSQYLEKLILKQGNFLKKIL